MKRGRTNGCRPICGRAYGDKREYDRAIEDFNQAIRLDPHNAPAFNNRGRAFGGRREYDRAIEDFDRAITLDPNAAVAFNNRCFARATVNQFQKAVADCNESLRLQPGNGALADCSYTAPE